MSSWSQRLCTQHHGNLERLRGENPVHRLVAPERVVGRMLESFSRTDPASAVAHAPARRLETALMK
jgi:hypothetical protein